MKSFLLCRVVGERELPFDPVLMGQSQTRSVRAKQGHRYVYINFLKKTDFKDTDTYTNELLSTWYQFQTDTDIWIIHSSLKL